MTTIGQFLGLPGSEDKRTELNGFAIGDYVFATYAQFDTYDGLTFVIDRFSTNLLGEDIVVTHELQGGWKATFYPRELEFEH